MVSESHARRGYDLSVYGYNTAYHYFIGSDGTVVHTRPDTDRTMHTKSDAMNMQSIAIVLAGSFETETPSRAQLSSLLSLIRNLQKKYEIPIDHVIAHGEASPTKCAGKNITKILQYYRSKAGIALTQKVNM